MLKKPIFFVFLAFLTYLSFGLSTLSNFVTADEHFWLPNYGTERIQDYWEAVADRDWEDTRINDKPGITLAYVSGIALPFSQDLIREQLVSHDGTFKMFDPEKTKAINFRFRLPLFLLNGLMILYFFWILRKIVADEWVAAWASMLMYLSPVLLGISQIVNPDTLFWTFGFATLCTFFATLKFREWRYVVLATLFFGLALASKYVAVIFIPFFFVMMLLDYFYRFEEYSAEEGMLARAVKRDVLSYWTVLLGGGTIFAVLMPAVFTDPELFFESTIGFGGMWPIFLAVVASHMLLLADVFFFKGRLLTRVLGALVVLRRPVEQALYAILCLAVVFVLFNWMLGNNLYDLSDIPFDAKTKETFTTENPFLARFAVEFVALTFSLTPLSLFLLIASFVYGIFVGFRERLLAMTLSGFMLVFYLAVIEQGLLVTARYSIILFPVALTLAAIGLSAYLRKEDTASDLGKRRAVTLLSTLAVLFVPVSVAAFFWHQQLTRKQITWWKDFSDQYWFLVASGVIAVAVFSFFIGRLVVRYVAKHPVFTRIGTTFLSFVILGSGIVFLIQASPHFFVYVNDFLPKKYLIMHSWGYGGYEIAEHLNQKPNAKELTLWTDTHGVCEFFVGKCIHKTKVDVTKYKVDYIFQSYGGSLNPKFPYEKVGTEWQYVIDGRTKNFMKIYKNDPVAAEEKYYRQEAAKRDAKKAEEEPAEPDTDETL